MKRKKVIFKGIIASALFTGAFISNGGSIVGAEKNDSIPQEVIDLANEKVEISENEVEEIKAWEEDLNGNITEVTPLSERNNGVKSGEISLFAPPKDGYTYSFDSYVKNSPRKDWYFQNLGVFRIANKNTVKAEAQYEQQETVTTNWKVSANLSGKGTIGKSFLAGIEATIGGSYDYSKTTTKGKKYGVKQEVPPKTTHYITAYAVGGYDNGRLRYKKYAPGGSSLVGYYYETASGTAVNKNDVNVELTRSEPIK
ncbi:hypothetical protein KGR20_15750 [Cytobacillus oceanisediminis]|uniref:epsilon-toxin family protein n=1 Tax=Bacillaceae TaxID=186817 RepID=UPI001CCFA87B|nr:epsilon-toxin family protein [Cytobacillus oceanisediminis]MBQ6447030.1 hypothetical protein [Bacillus sp. (in: firmicutes)]MBZ9535681.1 hypothetical protein [Cytobacillus oceanisediminis]